MKNGKRSVAEIFLLAAVLLMSAVGTLLIYLLRPESLSIGLVYRGF